MNDFNRNTRTLIVSFVFAVMALIPLRFMEVGQMVESYDGYQVLGQTSLEVVLPNAEVTEESVLEAPYDEIDKQQVLGTSTEQTTECITKENAEGVLTELTQLIEKNELDRGQLDEVIKQMVAVENGTCK